MKHKTDLPHSSSISCCEYDTESKEMHVTFASGGRHKFEDVAADVYHGLCKAESPGRYFHANVRRFHKSSKVD